MVGSSTAIAGKGRASAFDGHRFADVNVRQSGDKRDIAGVRSFRFRFLQPVESENFGYFAGACFSVRLFNENVPVRGNGAVINAPHGETTQKIVVSEIERLKTRDCFGGSGSRAEADGTWERIVSEAASGRLIHRKV